MNTFYGRCRPGAWWLCALLIAIAVRPTPASAQPSVADELAKAINHYAALEFDPAIDLATGQLKRSDLSPSDRAAVYSVLSMVHYAQGKTHFEKAFSYLDKIMEVGPCVTDLPFEYWPKNLREHWYGLLKASNQLTCDADSDPAIRTIAIMEFDNFSTGKYQEELGYLTKGISDFFEADFAALNSLKVVERDKIDYILKEIVMTQEGLVDQATAVKAGKLLGAQIMVFGSVMQMDDKHARMIVKAVKVETSEVLATAERSGKPELFAMEQELVKELAQKLELELDPAAEKKMDAYGTDADDAAGLYSRGLYHVDHYEYAKAYDYFKQAYEMDATFAAAKKKMDIYRPLAMSS